MDKTELPKNVTAAHLSSSSRNGSKYCKNCHKQGHFLSECSTVQCQYCHKICHIVYNCPTKPPKPGQSGILPRPVNHSVVAVVEESLLDPSLSSISVSEEIGYHQPATIVQLEEPPHVVRDLAVACRFSLGDHMTT